MNPELNTLYDLIEFRGATLGEKPYMYHEDLVVSYADYNKATCRAANGLARRGGNPRDGLAVLMGNCPEYLYLFNGLPRGGFYTVPVNTALKKEGLRYILTNSDVRFLAVDDVLYHKVAELEKPIGNIEKIFVRKTTDHPLPAETVDLSEMLDAPPDKPDHTPDPNAIAYLMYTSGTTGFPKGVVNRVGAQNPQATMMFTNLLLKEDDILYTGLPLFHGNALLLTVGFAMGRGASFALDKRFSASGFWDSVRRYKATQFNALGAVLQILMKQPEKPDDGDNPVRMVLSGGCPKNIWEAFEKRFNVTIWEIYGAVDGGGINSLNLGNAPVGSIGKPIGDIEWMLVDDNGREVPTGAVGELVHKVKDHTTSVEYFKNPEATRKKVRNGLVYSGDLFTKDAEGNLYFVDRKTDSMRRRGENISSFEVESLIEKHPAVAECAAFGVPSDLGEDDVMIWVRPKADSRLDVRDLIRYCADNMAYFMVPRFVDVVEEIPKTETLRFKKNELKSRGVTELTWDREKEMPDFKPEK
ncbi:MAG: AMP-binding protein [Desulfobacterales bacterium]